MAMKYLSSRTWLAAGVSVFVGCAAPQQQRDEASAVSSALTWVDGALTMDVEADVEPVRCEGPDPTLGVSGVITATGDGTITAVAMITGLDGSALAPVTIASDSDFVEVEPGVRVASFAADQIVPNGMHDVELCFALVTPRGISRVQGCLPVFSYDLDCSTPIDDVPPTIVGSAAPAANAAGWNNTDVTVSFMCEDFESGIASCSSPVVLSSEGAGQSASGMAMDNAGNSASTTVSSIHIDKTAPNVSLSGTGSYTVDQSVSVTCSADDALSGVASSTCNGASGPAYSFGVGSHAVTASASDFADNSASASGSFTVVVTRDSLCNLINQFVTKAKPASYLCGKLSSAETELNRGHVAKAESHMRSYDVKLVSITGTAVSVENAMILEDLGQAFIPH
jgi:hypothetical protein